MDRKVKKTMKKNTSKWFIHSVPWFFIAAILFITVANNMPWRWILTFFYPYCRYIFEDQIEFIKTTVIDDEKVCEGINLAIILDIFYFGLSFFKFSESRMKLEWLTIGLRVLKGQLDKNFKYVIYFPAFPIICWYIWIYSMRGFRWLLVPIICLYLSKFDGSFFPKITCKGKSFCDKKLIWIEMIKCFSTPL